MYSCSGEQNRCSFSLSDSETTNRIKMSAEITKNKGWLLQNEMVLYQPLQRKAAAASLPKGRAQVRIQKSWKKYLTDAKESGMISDVAVRKKWPQRVSTSAESLRAYKKSWKKYLTSTKRCAKMIELLRERSGRNLDNWTVTTLKIRENKFWKTNLKQ